MAIEQAIEIVETEAVVVASEATVAFLESTRALKPGRKHIVHRVALPQVDLVESAEEGAQVALGVRAGDEELVEILSLKRVARERAQVGHACVQQTHEILEIRLGHVNAEQAQARQVHQLAEVTQIELDRLETSRAEHVCVYAEFVRRVRLVLVLFEYLESEKKAK